MTLLHASLGLVCACLHFATLIAATAPAPLHEARQATQPPSTGPGPVSIRTSSSTSTTTTTMSPTPSCEPSSSSSSIISPLRSSTPSTYNPSLSSSSSGTPASPSPSTRTSATPQPSSSPENLTFTVQNMTTCTSGLISWSYSGEEAELLLSITNIAVPRNDGLLLNDTIQQLVDTNTSASSFVWPSVNISQGWYEVEGRVLSNPSVSSNSAPFFVSNGTDVSCLAGASPQASSTGASSDIATSKSTVGRVVGGVVGGVVGVTLVVIAAALLWSRRRRRRMSFIGRGGRKGGAWGSLKSTSSSIHPAISGGQFGSNHSHSESEGAILQDVAVGKASATTTPGGSDEDVIVVSQEKLVTPAPSAAMSPFDALSTPIHYDRRASTYSVQNPTTVASDPFRSRVPSVHTPVRSLEQQAQRIRSSMETSMRRRSDRLSMPNLPPTSLSRAPIPPSPIYTQSNEEYPLTPVTPTPVKRSISAASARRASRKPVPHYDSSLLEDKNADSVSTFTAGAESSHSHGTGMGTGANGTASDLTHKASFGDGRPVHYLIPDMPLPQQD